MKQDKPRDESAETIIDDFFDARGSQRAFRLSVYAGGRFLDAVELRDGQATGLRFVLPIKGDDPLPWGEMRDRIRERLSQRDLVRDEDGRLHDLRRVIRAQISDEKHAETGMPVLLVDDMKVDWEELGEYLMTYAGWGLRIEIRECGEE